MNLLVFTSLWPNGEQPNFGVFVKHRVAAMARQPGVDVRVVAPVPYFPKQLQWSFVPVHWRRSTRIADRELIAGIETAHPRCLVTPKLGMSFYGRWMASGALEVVRRMHAERPFDLIDAHYAFPDGEAAVRLGAALKLPVVITARGTDINLFTRMPLIRPRIRRALERAQGVIAVSGALRERIVELGIAADKVAVIRNGIDRALFAPRDRNEAQRKLGLDPAAPVVVTVGALVPLKGIDRLIDAVALMARRDARLYVIGEGSERAALTARIAAGGLAERVKLVGARAQTELADWYSACDLFCLASTREGCPNVVIEALAGGAPVVAVDVGGIRELVCDPAYGRVVAERASAAELAAAIDAALALNWERGRIAVHGGARSWDDAAREVLSYYTERGLAARGGVDAPTLSA